VLWRVRSKIGKPEVSHELSDVTGDDTSGFQISKSGNFRFADLREIRIVV
jgi:hypothetical protein